MVLLPTRLVKWFRKDGTWQGFFKMPQHLDSPLEIDFTDIHIKEFIQRYCDNFVVYMLGFNPVSDLSVEGFIGKESGEPVKRSSRKTRVH